MRRERKGAKRLPTSGSGGLSCPFCGEAEEIHVDAGGGDSQVYIEDCAVCCRPRLVHIEPGDRVGEVRIWLERSE